MRETLHRRTRDNDRGFTLIELLVVIVIIGILAAIAIPIFLNQRRRGIDASMKADLKAAANAMETYYSDYQTYGAANATVSATNTGGVSLSATDPLSKSYFRASPGNNIDAYSGDIGSGAYPGVAPGTYCVRAANAAASPPGALYYDSDRGGLLPAGMSCY